MIRTLIVATFFSFVGQAQETKVIKLPELQQILSENSGKIHIFNFWATWCGPICSTTPSV